jgi:hypothetical protein
MLIDHVIIAVFVASNSICAIALSHIAWYLRDLDRRIK